MIIHFLIMHTYIHTYIHTFLTDNNFKIIRNHNPSKTHGHDKYSNVENLL